jgi:hypothetical protein
LLLSATSVAPNPRTVLYYMKFLLRSPATKVAFGAVAGLALAVSANCGAITFRDIDNPGGLIDSGQLAGYLDATTRPTYNGTFNLVTADSEGPFTIGSPYPFFARGTYAEISGFNPDTMEAISGKITFWVKDDEIDSSEAYSIDLGALNTQFVEGATFASWRFDKAGLSADLLVQINETGDLDYHVTATSGDFILDYAMLEIDAVALSVPDGGLTAGFLGLALIGVFAVQRRK